MHLSIVVEIIYHISHWGANTMNKRISMIERIRQKEGGKLVAQCKLL
jgi:hypothetical protein